MGEGEGPEKLEGEREKIESQRELGVAVSVRLGRLGLKRDLHER